MNKFSKLAQLLVIGLAFGCAPKPDSSLILWEQPAPQIAAQLHAQEIGGIALYILPTGSMEPFLTAGDYIVADTKASYTSIKPGMLVIYQASWLPTSAPVVCHMAAAKSGDKWIMSGIANAHYENAANGGLHMGEKEFRGIVVKVYTKRVKK